jgi:hypothetical protein
MGHPSRFSKHSYTRIFQQTVSAFPKHPFVHHWDRGRVIT